MPRWSDLADRAPEWPLTQVPGPGISWVGGIGDGQVGVFWELVLDHSFRSCSDLLDFLNPGLSKLSALKKTMSYYVHNSFHPCRSRKCFTREGGVRSRGPSGGFTLRRRIGPGIEGLRSIVQEAPYMVRCHPWQVKTRRRSCKQGDGRHRLDKAKVVRVVQQIVWISGLHSAADDLVSWSDLDEDHSVPIHDTWDWNN